MLTRTFLLTAAVLVFLAGCGDSPQAEEKPSKMITFQDENGVHITAPEDILLGKVKSPEIPRPQADWRAFEKKQGGSTRRKTIPPGQPLPKESEGWKEIPLDPSMLESPVDSNANVKKYQAYLEREKLKKDNPAAAAEAARARKQIRVGRKNISSPPPDPGPTVTLRIPKKPSDPIEAYYYKHTVGEFLRMQKGEAKKRDQNALDTMELFCRLVCARDTSEADVCMAWKDEPNREPIADLLYEIAEITLYVDEFDANVYGPRFVSTTAELERLGYSPYLCFIGHIHAAREIILMFAHDPVRQGTARNHIDRAEALLPDVLKDAELTASSLERFIRMHYENLISFDKEAVARTLKLFSLIESMRPELAPLCKGGFYVDHAWNARGNGFSNTVTDDGWKLMAERLSIARKSLEEAWRLQHSTRCASYMISVCMGESKEDELQVWYNRGIELAPGNHRLRNANLQALCAKWHGSDEQMFSFARESVKLYQKDTSRNYQNAMLICVAHDEGAPQDPHDRVDYFKQPRVYGEIKDVLTFIVRQKPKAVDAWSTLAYYAIQAEDYVTAMEAFKAQDALAFVSTVKFGSGNRVRRERERVTRHLRPGPVK